MVLKYLLEENNELIFKTDYLGRINLFINNIKQKKQVHSLVNGK